MLLLPLQPVRPTYRAPPSAVYGLVKFASASNYIVAFWTDSGREVCQDLNLPCADIRSVWMAEAGAVAAVVAGRCSINPSCLPLSSREPPAAPAYTATSLPCLHVRPLLEARKLPLEKVVDHVIPWVKPIMSEELLARGYAVHISGRASST